MKSIQIFLVIIFLSIPLQLIAEDPVLVTDYTIDTSLYDRSIYTEIVPGPFLSRYVNEDENRNTMFVFAYKRKNSKQYDIYSFEGKCGTVTIPTIDDPEYSAYSTQIVLSRFMVDGDEGWESLVIYWIENDGFFKVFDDNGKELLSDEGGAFFGFDGYNTYVFRYKHTRRFPIAMKSWRLRTNIMSPSAQPLAKTKSSQVFPMQIYGGTGGDYRVTLSPSNGNQMNFQMFDLIGRCVFSKKIDNPTTPVTFTVPAGNVPNSPFIAKVNDGNGSFYKKGVPVK